MRRLVLALARRATALVPAALGLAVLGAAPGSAACASAPTDSGQPRIEFDNANALDLAEPLAGDALAFDPESDLSIDWCNVSTGLPAEPFDPLSVDFAAVVRINLANSDSLWRLGTDTLLQSQITGLAPVDVTAGACTAALPVIPEGMWDCQEERSYALLLSGSDGGEVWALLDPCVGSTSTAVVLPAEPMVETPDWCVPMAGEPIAAARQSPVLDWSALNASPGAAVIDPLSVGAVRLVPLAEPADTSCAALATGTDPAFTVETSLTASVPLDAARDPSGSHFDGFEFGGSWLVALFDSEAGGPPVAVGEIDVE